MTALPTAYTTILSEAEDYVLSSPPHLFNIALERRFEQVMGAWELAWKCGARDIERPGEWQRRVEAKLSERKAA